MIASLRARHFRTWLILAVVLPFILIAAWASRRPLVMMERIPAVLTGGAKP